MFAEAFRAPVFENGRVDKNGFNLGLRNNFKQIFGNQYVLWPFPVFTRLVFVNSLPKAFTHPQTVNRAPCLCVFSCASYFLTFSIIWLLCNKNSGIMMVE